MQAEILINGVSCQCATGLVRAQELYDLASCSKEKLFIKLTNEIDLPLDPNDVLVIRDGISIVTDSSSIENNPQLPNEIQIRFNGEINLSLEQAKITGSKLKNFDNEHPEGRLFVDISNGSDAEISNDMTVVVQKDDSFFIIPTDSNAKIGDPIDIESCGRHGRRPPKGHKYRNRIDRRTYVVEQETITGAKILKSVDKSPENWILNQKMRGGERKRINPDDTVNLSQPGIERFETVLRQAQQGCV
ncbi:MAG: multiubiquitin domain-containing protein [Aestuariivita sp.]|nr:multiubiquitin domain-containing protein [Aestuariivita sp.]MCY4347286.1 multiubiquitin domain-containing protein [Aestuariivita sp.]